MPLSPPPPNQVRDSLGRLVELPIDTHPGHYRRETATIHSSAIVRLASQLRKFPPGEQSGGVLQADMDKRSRAACLGPVAAHTMLLLWPCVETGPSLMTAPCIPPCPHT